MKKEFVIGFIWLTLTYLLGVYVFPYLNDHVLHFSIFTWLIWSVLFLTAGCMCYSYYIRRKE